MNRASPCVCHDRSIDCRCASTRSACGPSSKRCRQARGRGTRTDFEDNDVDPPDQRERRGERHHAWRHASRRRTCRRARTCGRCSRASASSGAGRGSCASARLVRARARGHELSLVLSRPHAHPRHHVARSALLLRRRERAHGRRRGLVVRQLAPASRREPERPRARAPRRRHVRHLDVLAIRRPEREPRRRQVPAVPTGDRCRTCSTERPSRGR